jgi:hypothetical protein
MPFVLFLLGVLFLVVAVRGTQAQFFDLIKSEFTGANNFLIWVLAIVILGLMIGYLKAVRPIAHAMIGLIILVMIIANKGVFARFNEAFRNPATINPPAPAAANLGTTPTPTSQNMG